MNKSLFKSLTLSILSVSVLSGENQLLSPDDLSSQNINPDREEYSYESKKEVQSDVGSGEHSELRFGLISSSGTFNFEHTVYGESPEYDLEGSGFEVSLVGGVERSTGFDYRSALTFQMNDIDLKKYGSTQDETSDMMLLGEYEFAYNINQYLSPFIGFYGGIGLTDMPSRDESSCFTYDIGWQVGLSGALYGGFGYYVKHTSGYRGYNIADGDMFVAQDVTTMKYGISFAF
ncbi:MAG: hypothetical protein U9N39_07600 [Campylobacterota bacterium]|nr:hypothetical protein [Campylobacterota bacterium]